MYNKLFIAFVLVLLISVGSGNANALSLTFEPSSSTVVQGESFTVGLRVTGLADNTAPSLSVFDLNVNFNPAVLSFAGATFGDPILGDQLDLFALGNISMTTLGAGSVNVFEMSFDLPQDLDDIQADSFILATLRFDALNIGTSALEFIVNEIGDSFGNPLLADTLGGGSIVVRPDAAPVPEPSTFILLCAGIFGLATTLRRLRRQ